MKLAEELIYKGESHTAEWYEQHGLVDVLFEPDKAMSLPEPSSIRCGQN